MSYTTSEFDAVAPQELVGWRRRVGFDVGRLFSGEVMNKGLRFVATVILARGLTASAFGLVNVGIAISGIALVACSLGLPDLGAREAALAPERAGWLVGHVGGVRALALGIVSVVGVIGVSVIWPGHELLLIAAALMAIFMASSGDWLARGMQRMSVVALANATGGVVLVIASFVVVGLSGGATAALGAFAFGEAATAALLWIGCHRHLGPSIGLRGMGPMLRRARPLALSSLAIYSYYANLDTVIIAATHSDQTAGLYSAPYRLFLMFNVVGVFAAYAMLPTLSRLAESRAAPEALRLVQPILSALALYGLVTLGGMEVLGADLLGTIFGARFRAGEPTFVLLLSGVAWYAVGYPAGYSLIASNRNRAFLRGAAAASIINVGLDLALIPAMGIRGAGLATAVAFVAAAVIWMGARGLLRRTALPMLSVLTITTGAALCVAFAHLEAQWAGLGTLSVAAAMVAAQAIRGGSSLTIRRKRHGR